MLPLFSKLVGTSVTFIAEVIKLSWIYTFLYVCMLGDTSGVMYMWEPEVSLGYYSREVIFLGLFETESLIVMLASIVISYVLGLGVAGTRIKLVSSCFHSSQ